MSASCFAIPVWILIPAFMAAIASFRAGNFRIAFAAQLLLILLLGHFLAADQVRQYEANELYRWVGFHEKETVRVAGIITQTPEIGDDYYSVQMRVTQVGHRSLDGLARLTVTGTATAYPTAGDRVWTYARFRLPSNFGVPGAFDYAGYLRKEGIHALGSVKSTELIHTTQGSLCISAPLTNIRLCLIRGLMGEFSKSDASILRALWLDDRSGLSREVEQMLIDAGIYHVIAISGFHVSVLLLVLLFLMKKHVSYPKALFAAALFLLFYFLLLEGRSSITRSFLTFLIYAIAFWRYEDAKWSVVLPLSAMLQVVFNPAEIYDPGYLLTYLSAGSICFLAAPLCRKIRLGRKIYRVAVDFVIVSLSVHVVLLPYQAFVFHRIAFGSILANVIEIPLSSLLILAAPVLLVGYPIHVFLTPAISFLVHLFLKVAAFFSAVWLIVEPQPSLWLVALYYALLFAAIVLKRIKLKWIAGIGAACLVAAVLWPQPPPQDAPLRIHFVDVGQGDSIIVQYPDGTADIVDAGGFWNSDALDTGDAILLPFLTRLGVTKLHRAFLTHAHADHMNGLLTLMHYFPAERFYVTRFPFGDANFRRCISEMPMSPKGIQAGDTFQEGEVRLTVLAPTDSAHTSHVANDDSLVLLLSYQGKHVLLTGDAEVPTETQLASLENLNVDYLKVAHHGSKTSSTEVFLNKTHPKVAFISVGKNNWFGHPNPEVLQRLHDHHAMVYRTDQFGTITLTIENGYGSISTFR